jgi:hypothetical protein
MDMAEYFFVKIDAEIKEIKWGMCQERCILSEQ